MEYYIDNGEEKHFISKDFNYFAVEINGFYGIVRKSDNAVIVPFKYDCFDMYYGFGKYGKVKMNYFIYAGRQCGRNPFTKRRVCLLFGKRTLFYQSGIYDKYDWHGNLIEEGLVFENPEPENHWYGIQDYSERDMLNEFLDSSPGALGNIDWQKKIGYVEKTYPILIL